MKCHIVFLVCLVLLGCDIVTGSIVQLNESTLESLPPLYELEAWSSCQRPGDVYCMVDALLFADQPSSTMDLLQEYSGQVLKHFNRTQVHRGVCVTRCGAGGRGELQGCLNRTLYQQYGLQASILNVGWCSEPSGERTPSAAGSRALGVLVLVLLVVTSLATGLHLIGERCAKENGITSNKYLMSFSVKRNWQILTRDRTAPLTPAPLPSRPVSRFTDLAVIEGIRVLAIQCVIFSHVLFMYIYSYTDNPIYVEKMYDAMMWQGVLNSPLWLQAFFCISGLLTAYSVLVASERAAFTLPRALAALAARYVRLTPAAGFALWFTVSWFPALGAGPQWGWLVAREAHDCSERWHHHLFYTHNHLPLGKFCMGHTWYLAVDMQLHAAGVLVLAAALSVRRAWRVRVAGALLGALVALNVSAAGLVTYLYDLYPIITAQAPEGVRTLFAGSRQMSLLYLPSWMNAAGYAGGMAVAFILHHNHATGYKLHENKWFSVLFHSSLALGGGVVLGGTWYLQDGVPALWSRVLYACCDRVLVALAFSVFLLGCVSRCRSALRDMLDWRGFHTLGRLSYCAFLIHFIVLRVTVASDTRLQHVSLVACMCLFITSSVLTYLAAIPVCLLVELPFTQLWKVAMESERPTTDHIEAAAPAHRTGKTFDLVAHVSGTNVAQS